MFCHDWRVDGLCLPSDLVSQVGVVSDRVFFSGTSTKSGLTDPMGKISISNRSTAGVTDLFWCLGSAAFVIVKILAYGVDSILRYLYLMSFVQC